LNKDRWMDGLPDSAKSKAFFKESGVCPVTELVKKIISPTSPKEKRRNTLLSGCLFIIIDLLNIINPFLPI